MARPKKHSLPISHASYIVATTGLSLEARAAFVELVWWFVAMEDGAVLPTKPGKLAAIVRYHGRQWERIWREIAPLFVPFRDGLAPKLLGLSTTETHGNPVVIDFSTAPCGNPVEAVLKNGGNLAPVPVLTVPVQDPEQVPVLDPVTEEQERAGAGAPSLSLQEELTKADKRIPERPAAHDPRVVAVWLLKRALAGGGAVRGDILRQRVWELADAHLEHDSPVRAAAIPLAWNPLFWRQQPELGMRVAPDQPDTADPGHPEMEVWVKP